MCCIVEIAMTVWGIVTLARGEFALTGGKVVRGGAAYLIGAILSATLPVLLGIGVVLGLMIASQNGGRPMAPGEIQEKMGPLAFMDIVIVPIILGIVLAIAYANAEDPQPLSPPGGMQFGPPTNYPPPDPNNPYASPRAPSSPYANPYSDPNQRPPGT